MDIEKIKEEFGYKGKPKQWQVGFDALLRHMPDYLKADKAPVAEVPCGVGLCAVEVEEEKTPSGWVQPYVSLRVGNFEFKRKYHTRRDAENCVDKIRKMFIEE